MSTFWKLIKYDFQALKRPLLVLGILDLLIFSTALLANAWLGPYSMATILCDILGGIAIVALPIALFIFQLIYYYKSMYGDIGYFTMSLPVSAGRIIGAKVMVNALISFIAMLLIGLELVLVIIAALSSSGLLETAEVDQASLWRWTGYALFFLVYSSLSGALCMMLYVTVGNRPFWLQIGKYAGMIVFYFVFTIALQVITFAGSFALPWYVHIFENGTASFESLQLAFAINNQRGITLPVIAIIFSIGIVVGSWWYLVRSVKTATSLR